MPKENDNKLSYGLGLGGGAVRGIAHLGVLKALEEYNLKPNYLAGTSIGAFVAALYAFGKRPEEIREFVKEMNWLDVSRLTLSKLGLLSNEEIGKTIEKHIGAVFLEESPIPLAFVATDISTGERVILKEGKVSTAVMASTCVPGIFVPTIINERMLVDGGLVENVPFSPLKEMGAEIVVGVNLNGSRKYEKPNGLVDILLNAFDIAIDNTTQIQCEQANYVIHLELAKYSRTNPNNVLELYAEGYRSGMLSAKEILVEIEKRNPSALAILEQKIKMGISSK
ncbi:MAG: patatin-like phospholipase family protein [Leptospiraceae bacterium]|nr:patatin-like phospholipase family protein [Leptospiraceae bacterium]MCP5494518.1 patatin-like phospholipase family protein [Leptospiraceae bacterium]